MSIAVLGFVNRVRRGEFAPGPFERGALVDSNNFRHEAFVSNEQLPRLLQLDTHSNRRRVIRLVSVHDDERVLADGFEFNYHTAVDLIILVAADHRSKTTVGVIGHHLQ